MFKTLKSRADFVIKLEKSYFGPVWVTVGPKTPSSLFTWNKTQLHDKNQKISMGSLGVNLHTNGQTNKQKNGQANKQTEVFSYDFHFAGPKMNIWGMVTRTQSWLLGYYYYTSLTIFNQKGNFSFSLLDVQLHVYNHNDPFIPSGVYL